MRYLGVLKKYDNRKGVIFYTHIFYSMKSVLLFQLEISLFIYKYLIKKIIKKFQKKNLKKKHTSSTIYVKIFLTSVVFKDNSLFYQRRVEPQGMRGICPW